MYGQIYAVPRKVRQGDLLKTPQLPSFSHPPSTTTNSRRATEQHQPPWGQWDSQVYEAQLRLKANAAKLGGGSKDTLLTITSYVFSASIKSSGVGVGWDATKSEWENTQFSCWAKKFCLSQASFFIWSCRHWKPLWCYIIRTTSWFSQMVNI